MLASLAIFCLRDFHPLWTTLWTLLHPSRHFRKFFGILGRQQALPSHSKRMSLLSISPLLLSLNCFTWAIYEGEIYHLSYRYAHSLTTKNPVIVMSPKIETPSVPLPQLPTIPCLPLLLLLSRHFLHHHRPLMLLLHLLLQ